MNSNQNIPNGRSTSRIKNASQSQGFANKDLYGSGTNQYRQSYRTTATAHRASHSRNPYINNERSNQHKTANRPTRSKVQNNNGEMSESTIVKVIVGSILAAVILAIVIIIALSFMDFQL